MPFRLAPWPRIYAFVGDSHAARFDGLVFADHADPARLIVTQAHNHYGFRATEFSYDDGALNERLIRSLLTLNVLRGTREDAIPAFGRFRTAREPLGWEFGLRLRTSYRRRRLIISCGEVDARDVIRRLPVDARIALPFAIGHFPDDPPEDADPIAYDDLAAAIGDEYAVPLFRGLTTLRASGIENLALLGLPPPGLIDADYEAHCGFSSRRHVRYAVHATFNRLYAAFCAANGIAFIDTWPLVTSADGVLLPKFGSDGVHLNRDAAAAIVAALGANDEAAVEALDPLA